METLFLLCRLLRSGPVLKSVTLLLLLLLFLRRRCPGHTFRAEAWQVDAV